MESSLTITLSLLFLSTFLFESLADPQHFSIIGYSEEDLTSRNSPIELFEAWAAEHSRSYSSFEEKLRRFEIFTDNLNHIEKTNMEKTSYSLGLNEFADISHEEFKATYLGVKVRDDRVSISQTEGSFIREDVMDLPKSIDWRKKGAVAPVKNQGQCGSCWAFSTVAAVEGINQIVTGNLTILSEQELIDCDTDFNSGCNGGLMDYAFSYIASNGGLHTEVDYPYIMEEGTCDSKRGELEVVSISGYEDVPENSEVSLLKALTQQPVSVAIAASGRDFQFYRSF